MNNSTQVLKQMNETNFLFTFYYILNRENAIIIIYEILVIYEEVI